MILVRIIGLSALGLPDDNIQHWIVGRPGDDVRTHTPASSEDRTFLRSLQAVNGAGWRNRKLHDRLNQGLDITVSTSICFPSLIEAFRFRSEMARADDADKPHPMKGDIVIRCQEGTSFFEELLSDALILVAGIVPTGRTLAITYAIKATSSEYYREGEVVSVEAPGPPEIAELIFPESIESAAGHAAAISVVNQGEPSIDYLYTVGVDGPAYNDGGFAVMLAALSGLGVDCEVQAGVGLVIRTTIAGWGSSVTVAFYIEGAYQNDIHDNGSAGEVVTIEDDFGNTVFGDHA